MQLTSPAFANNQPIPDKYSCNGANISPPLAISQVPAGAQTLALIVDDPDAASGTWIHWLVWNIIPSTTSIAENTIPTGAVEGTTSFGKPGYGGPCPPNPPVHHYRFKLYALDTLLDISANSKVVDLQAAMSGHVLETTVLIGTYQKS